MAEKKNWTDYYEEYKSGNRTGGNNSAPGGKSSGNWTDYLKEADWGSIVGKTVSNRVNAWLQNHNTYISDYNNRYSGRKYNYEDSYVSDSGDWLSTVTERRNSSDSEADSILAYLDQYGGYLDKNWVAKVRKTLTDARGQQGQILDFATKDNEWWSSFGSEDLVSEYGSAEKAYQYHQRTDGYSKKYNGMTSADLGSVLDTLDDGEEKNWLSAYKASVYNDEMLNYDIAGAESSIQALEQLLAEHDTLAAGHYAYTYDAAYYSDSELEEFRRQSEAYLQFLQKYGSKEDIEKQISDTKRDINDAQRIQKGVELASVADPTSANYDPEFGQYSGYAGSTWIDSGWDRFWSWDDTAGMNSGYEDIRYDYINDPDAVTEYLSKGTEKELQLLSGLHAYSYMTKDQVDIYNYYYAKGGKEAADEYLDSIQDSLNAQQGKQLFGFVKGQPVLEMAFGVGAGLDQFGSGLRSLFSDKDYIPTTPTQYASGMVREDLADNGPKLPDWMGGASLGQGAYDLISTTANMVPSILTSAVVSYVNPAAGAAVGSALMGASSAGNAYQEALNLGYDKGQARAYSTLVGASEAGLQYLIGGIGKLGGKLSGKTVASLASKFDSAYARLAVQYGTNMLSEGFEEYLQEILTPMFKNFALGTDEEISLISEEAIYSFLLGAISSGFMEGGGTVKTAFDMRSGKKANINAVNMYGGSTKELIAEGLASEAGSESRQFAEIMKRKTDKGKNMTGYEIRQMVAANDAQFAVEEYNGIVKTAKERLTDLGQTQDVDKIAEAVAKRVTGQELTRAEKSALANSFGSRVAKEMADAAEQNFKSLEDRVGTKGRFGVSESGVATIRESEKAVDIDAAKVVSVGDGQITFQTEDGTEVYAGDIDFADDDQSFLVSAVSDIENITPAAAEAVMQKIVDKSKPLGPQMNGIDEAYTYGYHGYSVADLKAGDYVSSLTEEQMMYAYRLGESAKKISVDTDETKRVKMRTAAEKSSATVSKKEKAQQQKARFEADAEVYFMDGKSVEKFDEHTGKYDDKRMAAVNAAKILSKLGIGGKYYFFESYVNDERVRVYKNAKGKEIKAPNGVYTAADGSIYIDLNAGNKGQGTTLYTLAHELSHFVKDQSEKQFQTLANLVKEAYDKTDMTMHERVVEKQNLLSETRGEHVTYDEAFEEVVCDALSTMISDGSFFEKLTEIKVKDKGLFNTIKKFFQGLFAKFKKVYEGLTPEQKDAQDIREMKDMFDRIQTAFAEALVEASDNFHAAMESVVEAKAEPVEADEIITEGAVVTDGEGNRFSIRSMKHDIAEGKMFEDLKNVCGWTQAQVDTLKTQLKDLVEHMIPYRTILDMNETYGMEGRRFSPYKPNSDPLYKISMDFSTLCSKRLLTQYVIENLQLRENRPMSAEEQMAIRDMLNEYRKVEKGLQVACAMCYVEAARLKSPKQIQRWLDDPAPLLKDYFGKKNKAFNDSVKEAQADFKESKGYDREAPKKDMKPADVKELNQIGPKMRSQYQPSAEEQAIIDRAKTLPNSTYLTAGNLADLSETDPVIYDAYTAFVRTATRSKSLEKDEPYYYGDSTRDNGNGIVVTDSFIEAVNRENGMRFSSWSDWRIQHLLDYITAVIDNSVRGAAMHGYAKFGDEVRVLGKTGMMFNMSGVAGTQTGLNEDGSLSFSDTESIDVNEAIQLRDEFPDTAGLQCIGVSDAHITALLRSDIIDYVIPYHVSGLNADLRRMAKIYGWDDYTGTQHAAVDKSIKLENAVDKEHWHEEPVFSEFFVGYDTGMTGIEAMRASAEKYKQMCKDRGLTPKFNQFATEENYWKLLIDRKMINQKTGNLIRQRSVTPTFDFGVIKGVVDKFVDNYDAGLEARALNHIVENWDTLPQRIKDLKKQGGTKVKKAANTLANQTVAAQPNDTKYSYRGVNKDGIEVYETSKTVMNMSWKDRKAEYLNVMRNEYRGRTAKFERNGHVYYARFDQGSIRKHIFGDNRSSTDGVKALIKAGADGDVFNLVERTRYTGSQKNKKNHTKADYFDYFVKTVQIDGKVFDLVADVEKTYGVNDGYVYTLALVDNTTKKASPALGTPNAVPVNSAGNASTKTVAQPNQKVNKNSDRDSTGKQLTKEQQAYFANSVVRDADGRLMVMYHGTANGGAFTIFDGNQLGNESRTSQVGQGFYFTNAKAEAKSYTKNVDIYGRSSKGKNPYLHEVYLNIANPFNVLEDALNLDDVKAVYGDGTYDYFFDSWIPFYLNRKSVNGEVLTKAAVQAMSKDEKVSLYVDYLAQLGTKELLSNMVRAFPYGKQSELLAAMQNRMGYDGIVEEYAPGKYQYVAFSSEQIKNVDNTNPTDNPDIRYSERTGDSVSNRSLLANAFEGITQSSSEYKLIQQYKGYIAELNSLDKKLSEMNAEIRKIRFGTQGARDTERLERLEDEAKKIAEAINRYDQKLLSLEASEPLRKVIERERKKEAQKTKDHVKEIQQNKKDRAEQTELRHKIRKAVRDLNKILSHGNKKQNVKEDMKGFASKALELADYLFTDHVSNDELIRKGINPNLIRGKREAELVRETEEILSQLYDHADSLTNEEFTRLDAKRKANLDKLRDLLTAQRNERLSTPVYDLFNDLVTEYASLKNSKQEAVKAAYNEVLENSLRAFIADEDRVRILKNMRVADMTTEELNWLLRAYTMVLTNVRKANELFVKGKTESIEKVASAIMRDFDSRKVPDKKVAIVARNLANKIGWDYEKLYYALDRIGSEAFTELIMNLANSENIVMQDIIEAATFRDEIVEKYGFNNWAVNKEIDREFLDNTGKKFKLTLGQLMSLYAYSRRKGAWDHIEYGGFVFGEKALTNPRPADSYKLSKAQCEAITGTLTKEQKAYVEDMQKFLSEVMGEKGNEVSMLMYGIKMFTEKDYFPIHIAGQFKAQAQESQAKAAAGFQSMSNAGFTHAQNPNAKAPFVLEGFNEVWSDHVNEMSRYHGTVPALEDIRRVMNRSVYSDSGAESMAIKQLMENSFGKEAVEYFDNLYREANSGAITDKLQQKSKKLLSLFRKNSVAYSLSVLVQQPASIVRAYAVIDRKYFGVKGMGVITSGVAKAVTNKWTKAHTNAYNEMLQYAPGVTMTKEIGGFDTATGGSIRSYLLDTGKGFFQTMKTGTHAEKAMAHLDKVDNNPIANLPNVADKIAWIEIWNACKRETVAKHKDLKPGSEEFMKIVGDRFTEVIRATQVYDSIFAKSPMLKSKNLAVQMLVSFMNEPNTVANMAESAVRDIIRGNWKRGARTAHVLIHSIIFTGMLKSIIYAMRDDDEDETYTEKYIEALTGSLMDDFNPLNYIPIARDVWSVAQGYDVERADMAIISDAIGALNNVIKAANTETEDMTEDELIELDKKQTEAGWQLVESLAALVGIPMKNIRREINAVIDHAKIASANAGKTTANSAWDSIGEAVIDSIPFMGGKSKTDKLYTAIIEGDTEYVGRLKATYKTEDAFHTAVRKALRENDPRIKEAAKARYEGRTEEYKRIFKEIQSEGKFSFDDIMSAINTEVSKLTPDKETSQYSASGFVEAIVLGDANNAQAMRDDIIATYVANGKTEAEAEAAFASAVATGIKDAFSAGLLDEAGAKKMLIEYADKDEEEAASKVSYWAFCEEHPEYKDVFTESHVAKYHEFAEPAGISVDVYAQFITGTKGLETIRDEWGEEVKSKRDQVLEVIDSLPLTWQQKDALYLAADYAESKIWDVPW